MWTIWVILACVISVIVTISIAIGTYLNVVFRYGCEKAHIHWFQSLCVTNKLKGKSEYVDIEGIEQVPPRYHAILQTLVEPHASQEERVLWAEQPPFAKLFPSQRLRIIVIAALLFMFVCVAIMLGVIILRWVAVIYFAIISSFLVGVLLAMIIPMTNTVYIVTNNRVAVVASISVFLTVQLSCPLNKLNNVQTLEALDGSPSGAIIFAKTMQKNWMRPVGFEYVKDVEHVRRLIHENRSF